MASSMNKIIFRCPERVFLRSLSVFIFFLLQFFFPLIQFLPLTRVFFFTFDSIILLATSLKKKIPLSFSQIFWASYFVFVDLEFRSRIHLVVFRILLRFCLLEIKRESNGGSSRNRLQGHMGVFWCLSWVWILHG